MIRLRPIQEGDFDTYNLFAQRAQLGLTSLPKEEIFLRERFERSLASFSSKNDDGLYLFVAEDLATQQVIGTTAIDSNPALKEPKFFFRWETLSLPPLFGEEERKTKILSFHQEETGPSELGGLFLLPELRHEGLGRFLSYSRFLFIAAFPTLFTKTLSAELRGVSDKNGNSPFWDHIGQHFCSQSYEEILLEIEKGRAFIPKLFPPHPIYVALLPDTVREGLGKTHPRTYPALELLSKQGFHLSSEIDVIDGGPRLEAHVKSIPMVQNTKIASLEATSPTLETSKEAFVGTVNLSFHCCVTPFEETSSGNLLLPKETAEALGLQIGDPLCYAESEQ